MKEQPEIPDWKKKPVSRFTKTLKSTGRPYRGTFPPPRHDEKGFRIK